MNDKKKLSIEEKVDSDLSSLSFRKNVFKGEKKKSSIDMSKMQDDIDILKRITEKLDEKVDKLKDVQYKQSTVMSNIEVILSKNTDSLVEHMRRTKASEDRLGLLETHEIKYRSFIKGIGIVVTGLLSVIIYFLNNFVK